MSYITNFLAETISKESEEANTVDSNVPGSDEALSDAVTQVQMERAEVDQLFEQADRGQNIVNELETQNAAVRGIVEANGELTESEAALVEAGRRAAVAGVGLDADEGVGERIVDQQGLEAMVSNRGLVALEQNQIAIEGIISAIKGVFEKIDVYFTSHAGFLRLFKVTEFNIGPVHYKYILDEDKQPHWEIDDSKVPQGKLNFARKDFMMVYDTGIVRDTLIKWVEGWQKDFAKNREEIIGNNLSNEEREKKQAVLRKALKVISDAVSILEELANMRVAFNQFLSKVTAKLGKVDPNASSEN